MAGWMKAKVIKLKRQRRAWARPFTIKSGIQANREVVKQYQDTVKGLGKDIAEVRFPSIPAGRHELMLRYNTPGDPLRGIIEDIRDPFFVTIVENARQRCRIYYNSQMTVYIIQWVNWREQRVRISHTYNSSARAIEAWVNSETVPISWKSKYPLRKG